MLEVKNLYAGVGERQIVKDVSLSLGAGRAAVLMGRNGSGKSTLLGAIMNDPRLEVAGSVELDGEDLTDKAAVKRAQAGLFLGEQDQASVEGLSRSTLLKHSANALRRARGQEPLAAPEFFGLAKEYCAMLGVPDEWMAREVGGQFSGGEKKRMTALAMLFFGPKAVLLDEPDSGVDVDSLAFIAKAISHLRGKGAAVLIVSHYAKLVEQVRPDEALVMQDGEIVERGDAELARRICERGFDGD